MKLGEDALPFIIEKLEQGIFFLNQAVVEIAGVELGEISDEELRFPSEQEKSALLVTWWRSQER